MNGKETGFLLLTSPLGNPDRPVLTPAQLRNLGKLAQNLEREVPDRDLTVKDLTALGYTLEMAERVYALLQEQEVLEYYCRRAIQESCWPLSQVSPLYPGAIFEKLGLEGPGSLWCKGDLSILNQKCVALVGSRDLEESNRLFAQEAGRQAAIQGYVLVSGNARGADQAAQSACLEAGGRVISVVADSLLDKQPRENILYISEDGYDLPFSPQRALSRNRVIHALGEKTFVAQCGYQVGGTWSGTVKNLRFHWSPVYCFRDESPAQRLLCDMGAEAVDFDSLGDFSKLEKNTESFL